MRERESANGSKYKMSEHVLIYICTYDESSKDEHRFADCNRIQYNELMNF